MHHHCTIAQPDNWFDLPSRPSPWLITEPGRQPQAVWKKQSHASLTAKQTSQNVTRTSPVGWIRSWTTSGCVMHTRTNLPQTARETTVTPLSSISRALTVAILLDGSSKLTNSFKSEHVRGRENHRSLTLPRWRRPQLVSVDVQQRLHNVMVRISSSSGITVCSDVLRRSQGSFIQACATRFC